MSRLGQTLPSERICSGVCFTPMSSHHAIKLMKSLACTTTGLMPYSNPARPRG